jgi:alanyl aminopeptidase
MAWWDDLWLNESFATWMAAKVLADIDPELDSGLDTVASAQRTMVLDSKRDARRIRQPIEHGGDVYNAFDGITYGKGAAVLRMVEAWTGEDAFRAGVRAYMRDHAYGSGGTVELLAALEAASGLPVGETMATFLDQPGTPLVQTELVCKEDAAPRLRLRQTRALPAGSEAPEGEPWSVPVCVALGTGDPAAPRARECFRLEEREQEVPLTAVDGCPTWVHPNAGERGYYRWDLPPEARVALVRDHGGLLDPAEAAAIPGHYRALLEAEVLPVGDLLEVLRTLAVHEKRQVVSAVAEVLFDLFEVGIPDPDSPAAEAFAQEVRTLLGRQLDRVGVLPQPGESADARLRRSTLVRTLAVLGRDPWIATRARSVASDFVVDPAAADEEVLGLLLPIAALDGDADLWDALVAIAADPPSPVVRGIVVTSLARFSDPELVRRSLGAVLDGRLRDQDYRTIARGIVPSARPAAWDWLTESYGELVSKLGPMASTALPWLAEGLCTRDDEKRIRAFFDGRSDAPRGTRRNVELVAEDVSRCARLRQAIQVDLAEALGAAS